MTRRVFPVVLALCIALGTGCSRSEPASAPSPNASRPTIPERRSVVLVTLGSVRADRLSIHDYIPGRAPAFNRLARDGVMVMHAVAVAPRSLPSHASMLTGLYPGAHGVHDDVSGRLSDDHRTVAEAFHDGGYATYAFVSSSRLERRRGLAQGFDVFDDEFADEAEPALFVDRGRSGERTATLAIERVRAHRRDHPTQPFFLWMHLADVDPPRRASWNDQMHSATPYDAEVTQVDRALGRLIDVIEEVGLLNETAIVVTADHGEGLGDHGEPGQGHFLYESTVHVPLVVRAPYRLPRGKRHRATTSGTDIAPTLLELADLPPLEGVSGRSFVGEVLDQRRPANRTVFSEIVRSTSEGFASIYAARDERFSYIRAPRPELYDRRDDEGERVLVLADGAADAARLEASLAAQLAEDRGRAREPVRYEGGDPEVASYRALVDVATATQTPVDPKDGIVVHALLEDARAHAQDDEWSVMRDRADEALRHDDRNVSASNLRGLALARLGDGRGAIGDFTRSLEIAPAQPLVAMMLGQLELAAGHADRALTHLDRALVLLPGHVDSQIVRAEALRGLGRADDAAAAIATLLASADRAGVQLRIGRFALQRGDFAAATAAFRDATAARPNGAFAHHALALALHAQHDDAGALVAVDRALALRGDVWTFAYDRARILASLGRTDDAFAALDRAAELGLEQPRALLEDADLEALRRDPRFLAFRRGLGLAGDDGRVASGSRRPAR